MRRSSTPRQVDCASSGSQTTVIGRGAESVVELDQGTSIVTKRYLASGDSSVVQRAQREFDRLSRLSIALDPHPYVCCPKPFCVDLSRVSVKMSYCHGVQVKQLIRESGQLIRPFISHISKQAAIAIECYIEEFSEPIFDLATQNLVFDLKSRILCIVDFTGEFPFVSPCEDASLFDTSLGSCLALMISHTVRPVFIFRRQYWISHREFLRHIVTEIAQQHDLSANAVTSMSDSVYFQATVRGGPLRKLWFRTIGRVVFVLRRNSVVSGGIP